jgi:16S rRNA (cytosine1402-N4)-methyltransferase
MNSAQLALPGLLPDTSVDEWVWSDDAFEESQVNRFVHVTVMRDEVVRALAPHDGGVYVDATLGGGGHSEAILEAAPGSRIVAFDRDPVAIDAARERLAVFDRPLSGKRPDRTVTIVRACFGSIRAELEKLGIRAVDGVVADLGVSSPQLEDAARGMSFRRAGPIDMRMDPDAGETALELIARLSDDELADVLFHYGEERRSRRIARSIRKAHADGELETTLDLRRAIVRAVGPARVGGVDPATRTFQALRIAVNRELDELESLLGALPDIVAPGGVAAIISFHSLEDRLIKRTFQGDAWERLSKKPLTASEEEQTLNPRARSAKLRAAKRLSMDGDGASRDPKSPQWDGEP